MTVLLIMLCVLVYVGAFEIPHENSEYNAKRLAYYIAVSLLMSLIISRCFPVVLYWLACQ